MEKTLTELQFSIIDFECFYINYLKRQNTFLETYFRRIKNKTVDVIPFQDIMIDDGFFIKIIKKIYSGEKGEVTYSPFIIVFKYKDAVNEEKAVEDMHAFSSFLSIFGGTPFKIEEVKGYNLGTELKVAYTPKTENYINRKDKIVLNSTSIDITEALKKWFTYYRHRAFSYIVDVFITSFMRKDILRRDITDFVNMIAAFNTIARDRISGLKNTDKYRDKFEEILNNIANESHKKWLKNYVEIRELRLDSKLNILFDTVKNIINFPNDTSKNRFITKIMETDRYYTKLHAKANNIFNEHNIPLVKQFLLSILRICILQYLNIPDMLIKKALDEDSAFVEIRKKTMEMIERKEY